MTILYTILAVGILTLPTVFEVYNDRHGDFDKKTDILLRVLLGVVCGGFNHTMGLQFLIAFNLSMAIFFLVFDYIIAYTLIKNGTLEPPRGVRYHWFRYTAKDGFVDNVPNWKYANPWLKLGIRVLYFTGSLILYIRAIL